MSSASFFTRQKQAAEGAAASSKRSDCKSSWDRVRRGASPEPMPNAFTAHRS